LDKLELGPKFQKQHELDPGILYGVHELGPGIFFGLHELGPGIFFGVQELGPGIFYAKVGKLMKIIN